MTKKSDCRVGKNYMRIKMKKMYEQSEKAF